MRPRNFPNSRQGGGSLRPRKPSQHARPGRAVYCVAVEKNWRTKEPGEETLLVQQGEPAQVYSTPKQEETSELCAKSMPRRKHPSSTVRRRSSREASRELQSHQPGRPARDPSVERQRKTRVTRRRPPRKSRTCAPVCGTGRRLEGGQDACSPERDQQRAELWEGVPSVRRRRHRHRRQNSRGWGLELSPPFKDPSRGPGPGKGVLRFSGSDGTWSQVGGKCKIPDLACPSPSPCCSGSWS